MTKEQFFNAVKYLKLDYHVNQDMRIEFSANTELSNTIDECPELETEIILLEIARNPDLLNRVKSIHWKDGLSDSLYMAVLNKVKTGKTQDKNKPVKGECTQDNSSPANFSLQAQPAYLTSKEYTAIKVRHWKEQYILPEIHNPVAVSLYALFRAYHAENGNYLLNLQTRYVYVRKDTGAIISAEQRKQIYGNIRTERIPYGLRELYRRSGGGNSEYQLMQALEQLTAQGYLLHDGADCYTPSGKQPERLFNADEFLAFAEQAGIFVSIGDNWRIKLDGDNETAKNTLQRMLDYSATLGVPDTLRVTIIYRLQGHKVFYDWD